MTAHQNGAKELAVAQNSSCVLRRRQPKVVVRAPEAPPGGFLGNGRNRRVRVTTLVGMGAREAMPTLTDIDESYDEPTQPRLIALRDISMDETAAAGCDARVAATWDYHSDALAHWDDDDDAPCFDV